MIQFTGRADIKLYNQDCMPALEKMGEDEFDFCICDPPYGIGGGSNVADKSSREWDNKIPNKSYFINIHRVSKNQIIWGGNYMVTNIPFNSTHTIIWDKENGNSFMSDSEIAFTSFNKKTTKIYRQFWMSNMMEAEEKPIIHPTQKPIKLYKWLLKNYANEGDTILDTHLGSMSIAIACWDMGYDLVGYEIDEDYFKKGVERVKKHTNQMQLF